MRNVVLCPRREGFPERERVWGHVKKWWADTLPDVELFEGYHNRGPFNRGAALNAAAANARRSGPFDAALLVDGDVLLDPRQIRAALAVAAVTHSPCLAYTDRHHLSKAGTEQVLLGNGGDWRRHIKTTYRDSCSSAYAVSSNLFDAVGGFDELFVGWGWEDVAFRCATEVISGVEMSQIAGPIWHLWHVVSSGNNPKEPTFVANGERGKLYRDARAAWDRDAMIALTRERLTKRLANA